jgi:hypothetical protein
MTIGKFLSSMLPPYFSDNKCMFLAIAPNYLYDSPHSLEESMLGFDEEVRAQLLRRRGKYRQIAELAGVSYSWVEKFARGKIDRPTYLYLRKLADLFATGTI